MLKGSKRQELRVFIGPVEISGIAHELSKGFRDLGVSAEVVLSSPHPFKYNQDQHIWLFRVWEKIGSKRISTPRHKIFAKAMSVFLHNFWSWPVLVSALFRFNAFIFLFGQTITNSRIELWLIKRLRKKIVFIYVGSDSRPPFINGGVFPVSNSELDTKLAYALARKCKRKIRLHEEYADYLVNSPSTAQYHERKFINWFSMGFPKSLPTKPSRNRASSDVVRILHCPSNPDLKGSPVILSVIDKLKTKGYPVELIKIVGMPNEVVLHELARCDFVVDQLYSDTPLAGLATEAAFFGKPAVVGGYFSEVVKSFVQLQDMPPSLLVAPADIETAIEQLIVDKAFRQELGEKARQFVMSHWSSKSVAERYLRLMSDDIPNSWWCDPLQVRHVRGCGMPQEHASRLVGSLIKRYGVSALQVADKPELEQAFIRLSADPRS